MKVLVTGATGYIGGRLVGRLLDEGHSVRCLARNPGKLAQDPWIDRVEVVQGDVLDIATLAPALEGIDFAYYLIHSMGDTAEFAEVDRNAAENFTKAAEAAGVRRIVYLGGVGDSGEELSSHLSSRQEVGEILASGTTPVTELRAAVIIGSGSVSFEMVRYLTEVLPVMTTPRWVRSRCQPIAIRDVLALLLRVLDDPEPVNRTWEIGGPEVLTYEDMMQIYASVAGLPKRMIIPVPVLSPGLSSLWIGLVTPLPVKIARPLMESLRHDAVVTDDSIHEYFPYEPISYRQAVELALQRHEDRHVTTRWSDTAGPAAPSPTDPEWAGGALLEDERIVRTTADKVDLFWAFTRIGGAVGYYGYSWAWWLRGLVDQVVGGVGLRRGRRHPEELRPGEALDFWRVKAVERNERLLLEAEMKLPGRAWLEWVVEDEPGDQRLRQTAYFAPLGLWGRVYWYLLWPAHAFVFPNMVRRIVETAEGRSSRIG